jgi:carboxymethylenebutenolidase
MTPNRELCTAGGYAMPILVAQPQNADHAPGLVVLQHAWGFDVFMEDRLRQLASHGYLAVAPDLFHRQSAHDGDLLARIRNLRDAEILRDVDSSVAYLRQLAEPSVEAIGVLGFCMGGRAAYLAAAHRDDFAIAAVFYPGNLRTLWGGGPSAISVTADIHCPVVGFFGREDKNPSPADVEALSAELRRAGKTHEIRMYDAGHAFLNFNDPPRYREQPARQAWETCVALLARHLRPAGSPQVKKAR